MVKALVTGGAGFIGSHLVDQLLLEGHEVIVLDNFSSGKKQNLEQVESHPHLQFIKADIREIESIQPYFEGVDWVFHLAALADIVPSIENPRDYFESNVDGTFNVMECVRMHHVKRVVYAASSSCYGLTKIYPTPEDAPLNPQYPYALTKYLGEQLVMHWNQVYKLPAISLRLFNVFGPRARSKGTYGAVFGVFLTQKLYNKPFTVVGDGTQTRDFIYVSDVANAFLRAAESNISGEVFNIGSGSHQSVNHLVELLEGDVVYVPKRPGEPDCTFADISKITEKLNWKPKVNFKDGVSKLLKTIKNFEKAPLWDPESIEEATKTWFKYLS